MHDYRATWTVKTLTQKNHNLISWITWVTVRTGCSLLASHSFLLCRDCFSYYSFACKSKFKINRPHPQQTFVPRSKPFQMWKSSILSTPLSQPTGSHTRTWLIPTKLDPDGFSNQHVQIRPDHSSDPQVVHSVVWDALQINQKLPEEQTAT